eukprot:437128-Pleurochrysis_carterae.AAC.2
MRSAGAYGEVYARCRYARVPGQGTTTNIARQRDLRDVPPSRKFREGSACRVREKLRSEALL